MSVLQCAAVALKASMSEVDSSKSLSHSRLHTLRQEHMMETLKCVLQMDSFLHAAASWSATGMFEKKTDSQLQTLDVQRLLNSVRMS